MKFQIGQIDVCLFEVFLPYPKQNYTSVEVSLYLLQFHHFVANKTVFVFIYCADQLNLKKLSFSHLFRTKIMSI
jgi:hypothetical protein